MPENNANRCEVLPPALKEDVIEEDWSHIMTGDLFDGSFAQHRTRTIQLPDGTALNIASTDALSPLDMMELSSGSRDATGHRIWMGAELWIQALSALTPYFASLATNIHCNSCLELGSGTGLAGIATFYFYENMEIPIQLVMTDNSESALDLCRFNCRENGLNERPASIQVELLEWGSILPVSISGQFQVVFATDVIYYIEAWAPLLETAGGALKCGGYLLVSHVPRAALPEDMQDIKGKSYHHTLEDYLKKKAGDKGFDLRATMRPEEMDSFERQQDMKDAGAAILIFQKGHERG